MRWPEQGSMAEMCLLTRRIYSKTGQQAKAHSDPKRTFCWRSCMAVRALDLSTLLR